MEIQTKHRKSAEQNRPKGRALFALAERKEAPYAALFAALTLALAAYVKTAFGSTPLSLDQTSQPPEKAKAQDAAVVGRQDVNATDPLADVTDPDKQPVITGKLEDDVDLGRIGRGPGMLDLSRFFADVDPALDMPRAYLADQPDIESATLQPQSRGSAGPIFGTPALGGGGFGGSLAGGVAGGSAGATAGGGQAGAGPGGTAPPGSGTGTDDGADAIAGINFHALFAQLASVVRPFHPTTVREISDLAIGDWVSQHELYRLRGGETQPDLDAAYLAREDRTYDIVTSPDSREAFIEQHFPAAITSDPAMPEATLAEDVTAAVMQPEPLLSTDTATGLL